MARGWIHQASHVRLVGGSIRSCLIVLSQRLNQQDPDATAQAFSGPMKARTDHPQAKSFNKPTDHLEIIQTLFIGLPAWSLASLCLGGSIEAASKKLLVVTVTKGFRHSSIPTAESVLGALAAGSSHFEVDYARTDEEIAEKMNPQALQQWGWCGFCQHHRRSSHPQSGIFHGMAPQRKGFHWHALQFRHLSWLPQVCQYDRRRVPDPWPSEWKSRLAWRIATILHVSIMENRFGCMINLYPQNFHRDQAAGS